MKAKIFLLGILLFLFSQSSYAQFFVSGQDRGSTHWLQIKTEHFRIVFPDYAETQAQIVANQLERCLPILSEDIKHHAKSIDIIMHMEAATSNGMVLWAPKRVELFNTPSQDMEAHNWWGHLMLHEYRHVLQIDKLNQGFTKVLSFLLGQQVTGSFVGLYLPMWYIEGDAVLTETKYSNAGRGRNPEFHRPLRAQLLDRGAYSYDKAYFGSYKDFTPNYYTLGYHLVTEGNRLYGDSIWRKQVDYVARKSFALIPFSLGLNAQTKQGKAAFHNSVMDSLQTRWQRDSTPSYESERKTILHKKIKHFTDYRFVQSIDDSSYFAVKGRIGELAYFIHIDAKGNEKRIHTPGYSDYYSVDVKNRKVVWSERRYHPRWDHVKYNNIMILDLDKKIFKAKQLTHYQRFFAPDLSPQGDKIVCSEVTKENNYALVILRTDDGSVLQRIPFKNFVSMPRWHPKEKHIYFFQHQPQSGKALMKINLIDGKVSEVLAPQFFYVNRMTFVENNLIIQASYSGVMDAYLVDEKHQKVSQLTHSKYGIDWINEGANGTLLYSDYSGDGYQPFAHALNPQPLFIRTNDVKSEVSYYADQFNHDTLFNAQDYPLMDSTYNVEKYRKITHLLNPHSWGPIAINGSSQTAKPGLQITSQNLLGTSVLSAGMEYDWNESANRYFAEYKYYGLFPELSLIADRRDRQGRLTEANGETTLFPYFQDGMHLQARIPFKLNYGKFYNGFSLTGLMSYVGIRKSEGSPEELENANYYYSTFFFSAHHLLRKAAKDMDYRYGFTFDYLYRSTHSGLLSYVSGWNAKLYLPGILKHHSIKFYYGSQTGVRKSLNFSNVIREPRGFAGYNELYQNTWSIDYRFPLFYPDWSIGPIAYIKRFKAALLMDRGNVTPQEQKPFIQHQSFSFELSMDAHFFRFIAPVELGFRYSALNDKSNPYFLQLLFNLDFNF